MLRLASLSLLLVAAPLAAQPLYSVAAVHPSPFGGKANAINDAGLVGGSVSTADNPGPLDPSEGFLWQDGVVVWQGSLGVPRLGTDAVGDAVSPEAPFSGEFAGFFRPPGGAPKAIPAPPLTGTSYRQVAYATGINDAGVAVGRWRVVTPATTPQSGPTYHPVVWDTHTDETAVLPVFDDLYARATGITEDGEVVGAAVPTNGDIIHAVRWTQDDAGVYQLHDLGTIDGGTYSECNAVNDAGTCFGEATTASNGTAQPALWERGQPGRLVPMPDGADGCTASGLNDAGDLVGRCGIARAPRAVVWLGETPYVLDDVLDASGAGWTILEAKDINADGWIVGRATLDGVVDSDGNPEGFPVLLRPVGSVAAEGAPAEGVAAVAAPNPLGASGTVLRVTLPAAGALHAGVYDVRGRRVRTLDAGTRPAGAHALIWDGRDVAGRAVAPGVYAVRVTAGDAVTALRVTVAR